MIGFHNSRFFNKEGFLLPKKGNKRKDRYGSAEYKFFKELRSWLEKNKAVHEHTFNIVWEGERYHYYGDFFLPDKNILIEIDPDFHSSYKEVADRDDFRDWVLKEVKGVETIRVREHEINDIEKMKGLMLYIEDQPFFRGSLGAYIGEMNK